MQRFHSGLSVRDQPGTRNVSRVEPNALNQGEFLVSYTYKAPGARYQHFSRIDNVAAATSRRARPCEGGADCANMGTTLARHTRSYQVNGVVKACPQNFPKKTRSRKL
jgi:hypothetical protein